MDYKKKYEEALERAKKFYNRELYAEYNGSVIEYIFPELEESEDERIRKEIVELFKAAQRDGICEPIKKEQFEKIFAWLEKQGKQNPTWSEEDENVINHLFAICAGAKRYRQFAGCLQDDITKYQTWLKSLKDRYTWKPSEEQIIELHRAISGCSYNIEPLIEIEKHLKKLREE